MQLPIVEGQKTSAGKLRVVANISQQRILFCWQDVVAAMMEGARVELGQNISLELSPDDILQLDEAGWWLLMKNGVVPSGWAD